MSAPASFDEAMDETAIVAAAEKALEDIASIRSEIGKVIFGQENVVEQTLLAILSSGHALLVGVPGLAKTKLVSTLGTVLGLDSRRVQFTPDLMPPDILGSEVMDQDADGRRSFRFIKGPIFTQLLMADEINRAPAKVQSALLEVMQERQVTIGRETFQVPNPFLVLATQNPIETEGTYPLPEAQLDRFLLQIDVPYPELAAERQILLETTGVAEQTASPVITTERLLEIQRLIRQMPVGESVVEAILDLVRSARPGHGNETTDKHVAWGPGPRAGQALMLVTRARALYEGRLAPSIDDVMASADAVLQHRMALTFAARAEGVTIKQVIAGLTGR